MKKQMLYTFILFVIFALVLSACGEASPGGQVPPDDSATQGGEVSLGGGSQSPDETPDDSASSEDVAPPEDTETPDMVGLPDPDADHPIVTITMENGGVMTLELYPEVAPNTVNNFIHLIQDGFYDGVIFHRVIPTFMIQGGDPQGTGMGGPGYMIKAEFTASGHENNLKHERGVLSMARQGNQFNPAAAYDTGGSQFFIMHQESLFLDGEYTGFGKLIDGFDVLDEIATTQTAAQDRPVEEQRIQSITVDTLGVDYPEPERIEE